MTRVELDTPHGKLVAETGTGLDISVPLTFDGPQPNHFGAPAATGRALRAGDFIGDTRSGGSCNCEQYELVPHCNGTHTECIGHVTDDRIAIRDVVRGELVTAALVSIHAEPARDCGETTLPPPPPAQPLITRARLEKSMSPWLGACPRALVLRTLPNDETKRTRDYLQGSPPPCFSSEGMQWLVNREIEHLLVDIPSLDQIYDEGRLTTHRIFWGLPPGSRDYREASRPEATVTEMIYAPDSIPDGLYLLNLQVPPFMADAAPSRPLLYPLELI